MVIGSSPLPSAHLIFETAGFAVGGLLYWRNSNAASQPPDRWTRWGLLAGAAVGAAVGSRALYMLQYWQALAGAPLALWLGGKTIVGGLLGGLLGVEIAKRALHWSRARGSARRVICASPTRRPSNALTKDCAVSSAFSPVSKPRPRW